MTISVNTAASPRIVWWKPLLFLLVVVVGLWYVKWQPYYGKAFTAAGTHSIGSSIPANGSAQPWRAALDYAQVYFLAVWKAAVLGILLGSLVQVLIPRARLMRTLGQGRFSSTLLGTLFSLPGMMCTCCAAPVVAGMRQCRVSPGAAMAFWLGNPLLNPATLVFMGFVLGWQFAAIRLVAALIMVTGIARIIQRRTGEADTAPVPVVDSVPQGHFIHRWARALWSLFWRTVPLYVLAVLLLGAARVWLFPQAEGATGQGPGWIAGMALAGALFVIPTAAEIPVVQALMLAGMGSGPALALLMTLPALSLPSLLMLHKAFSARSLLLTFGLVVLSGIAVGLLGSVLLLT